MKNNTTNNNVTINNAQVVKEETTMTNTMNTQELVNKLAGFVRGYDAYTDYIDNYRQQKSAEEANDRIAQKFVDVCTEHGIQATINDCGFIASSHYPKGTAIEDIISEFISKNVKEDVAMNETTNVTVNETTIKEETTMTMEALVKRIEENQKVQDADYVKRDELRKLLNEMGFRFNNKATRTEMVDALMKAYKDSLNIADEVAYGNEPAAEPEHEKCSRCGGTGIFYTKVHNGNPVKAIPDDGVCYRCLGTGIEPHRRSTGVPVGDFSMDNAPANDVSKESEVLPENIAKTVYQFTRAQLTQVLGKVLMDSTAQEKFGTVSEYILRSHVAKVLFNKTMNVIKDGKFTKDKTEFSDSETAEINEFIHKMCVAGYIKLNASGKSYVLSDNIKNKKGIWRDANGVEYVVNYSTGEYAQRNNPEVLKLSAYQVDTNNKKKLNRYVLEDTCEFQGFAKGVK